jgi:hypothetical protein
VIVNIDENRRDEVEALADFVPHLIVTHPLSVARQPRSLPPAGRRLRAGKARRRSLCDAFEYACERR